MQQTKPLAQQMRALIIPNDWLGEFMAERSGLANGYVLIPEGHWLHGKSYDEINAMGVNVHYGLTFSGLVSDSYFDEGQPWAKVLMESEKGFWAVGFDTLHYMDSPERWPEAAVMFETTELLLQLIALEPRRTGKDICNEAKALKSGRKMTPDEMIRVSELSAEHEALTGDPLPMFSDEMIGSPLFDFERMEDKPTRLLLGDDMGQDRNDLHRLIGSQPDYSF